MLALLRRRSGPAPAEPARGAPGGLDARNADTLGAVTTPRTVEVDPEHDGARLDNFLTAVLPEQSRSQLQRLIKEGTGHRRG